MVVRAKQIGPDTARAIAIMQRHLANSDAQLRALRARSGCLGTLHTSPCTDTSARVDRLIDRVTAGIARFESRFKGTRAGRWFVRRVDESPRFGRVVRGLVPAPVMAWEPVTMRFARDDGTPATASLEVQRPGRSAALVRRTLIAAAVTAVSPIPLTGLFVGGLAALRTGIEAALEMSLGDRAGAEASLATLRTLGVVATLGSVPGLSFVIPGLIVRAHGRCLRELARE